MPVTVPEGRPGNGQAAHAEHHTPHAASASSQRPGGRLVAICLVPERPCEVNRSNTKYRTNVSGSNAQNIFKIKKRGKTLATKCRYFKSMLRAGKPAMRLQIYLHDLFALFFRVNAFGINGYRRSMYSSLFFYTWYLSSKSGLEGQTLHKHTPLST